MSYIYSSSKNRRSGSTMQKMPRRGELQRQIEAKEILPGYPWDGTFKKLEEIEQYLSTEKIVCLICGKSFGSLARHVEKTHGIQADKYKYRFGIPQSRGLTSAESHNKRSSAAIHRDAGKRLAEWQKNHDRVKPGPKRFPLPPAVIEDSVKRFKELPKGPGYPKYNDFSWHLETMSRVWSYTKEKPPAGTISWSAFIKRSLKDNILYERVRLARSKLPSRGHGKLRGSKSVSGV